ncbi:3'-5' exonuclease [bacterium]|nr:MAG: 3'-5' exonuclease [bacterium]
MLNEQNFTIVDVETTGGSPFFSRIIEIGLLRIERGEVVEQFQTLINPKQEIPEFITRMTGISDQDVANAPLFEDIAEDLLAKFEDAIFVAHNVTFDYNFLREEFRKADLAFNLDRMCTVRLSRALYKEHKRHNLSAIIERYNFECANRHRAFDDAKVLWDFLQHSAREVDGETLLKAMKQVTTKTRLGNSVLKPGTPVVAINQKSISVDQITYEPEPGEALNIG